MTTTYKILFLVILFGGGGTVGWVVRGPGDSKPPAAVEKKEVWACPMHPQITDDHKSKCGICGMDLALPDADDAGPRHLAMSEADKKLAEIVTAPVERKFVSGQIQLVGKVDYD